MKNKRFIEVLIILTLAIVASLVIHGVYYHTVVRPNLYTIKFYDIDSIIKGSPVRLMGIIVGHVRNLKREDDAILCEIVVTKPNTKIPDGAVAKVEYNGLGGSKSIEIMPPKTDNPDVKGIVAARALRISDFMEVLGDLREVVVCIKQFVDGVSPQAALGVAKAVAEAPDFTAEANKSLDKALEEQRQANQKLRKTAGFERKIVEILNGFGF